VSNLKDDCLQRLTCPRFVKILTIEIFAAILGLFGLIIGLLMQSNAHDFE
jgi:F0F1-type ATP synthase membrane subunit c/vacuolar-type H+-ATPase subunit K